MLLEFDKNVKNPSSREDFVWSFNKNKKNFGSHDNEKNGENHGNLENLVSSFNENENKFW